MENTNHGSGLCASKVGAKYARFQASDKFSDIFDASRGDIVPSELAGATILAIGSPIGDGEKPAGGGLLIDYSVSGTGERKRAVIGFSDIGMWIDEIYSLDGQLG